jgi:hypothetical protein
MLGGQGETVNKTAEKRFECDTAWEDAEKVGSSFRDQKPDPSQAIYEGA